MFKDVHIPAKPRETCEETHQENTPPHEDAFSRTPYQRNDFLEPVLIDQWVQDIKHSSGQATKEH